MVRYYPVCKWKKGEREALNRLSKEEQSKIVPILEIVDDIPKLDLIEGIKNLCCPIYIDTDNIDSDDMEVQIALIQTARADKIDARSILSYPYTNNETLDTRIFDNCLFKIPVFEDPEEVEHSDIIRAIKEKNVPNFGVFVDIGLTDQEKHISTQFSATKLLIEKFKEIFALANTVVFATSSFPERITGLESGGEKRYKRHDIKLFKKILAIIPDDIKQKVAYSDYGVSRFTDSDIDFSILKNGILPKVKYTTEEEYIVLKGKRNSRTRTLIINAKTLALKIVNSDYYYGKDFSYGDMEIYNKSLPETKPGGNTNWVTYCANHHIAVVIDQTSSLFET